MAGPRQTLTPEQQFLPPKSVRVLRGQDELAEAVARAAEGARRLHDRLAARAARDAWMAEHNEQRVAWLRFVRSPADHPPRVNPVDVKSGQGSSRNSSSSAA